MRQAVDRSISTMETVQNDMMAVATSPSQGTEADSNRAQWSELVDTGLLAWANCKKSIADLKKWIEKAAA
eukprot:14403529-Heterocapsa_arctica.AAC.1